MRLLLAMLAVIAGGVVLYAVMLALASRKGRCPSCGTRALATDPRQSVLGTGVDDQGRRFPYSISAFHCLACGTEWRSYNGGGLVTKQAFEAGAISPIPMATVRKS